MLMWRSVILVVLLLALLLLNGCPSRIGTPPNVELITAAGISQALAQLRDTVLRMRDPLVDEVDVTEAFVRYHVARTALEVRLRFQDIARVDVYSNHVVFVWGPQGRVLSRPLLGSEEDAQTFGQLLLFFAQRAREGAGTSAPR